MDTLTTTGLLSSLFVPDSETSSTIGREPKPLGFFEFCFCFCFCFFGCRDLCIACDLVGGAECRGGGDKRM